MTIFQTILDWLLCCMGVRWLSRPLFSLKMNRASDIIKLMQSEYSLRDTVRLGVTDEDASPEHILDFFMF